MLLITLTSTLNLHACRQPIWAQVRQVKPTLKCNTNNYGVSLTTTKHAEIIHQSTPQIMINNLYIYIFFFLICETCPNLRVFAQARVGIDVSKLQGNLVISRLCCASLTNLKLIRTRSISYWSVFAFDP